MSRLSRPLALLSAFACAASLLAACGGGSDAPTSVATTSVVPTSAATNSVAPTSAATTAVVAVETSPPVSVVAPVDPAAIGLTQTTTATGSDLAKGTTPSPFDFVNLSEKLTPIPGFNLAPLPAEANQALLTSFEQNPAIVELVAAVGTSTVTQADQKALLIFLGLKRTLSATENDDFIKGVVGDGTGVEKGTVANQVGWTFVDADGRQNFTTVRNDTAILASADSVDHLAGVVNGLFAANPTL